MSETEQTIEFNILGPLAVHASTGPVPLSTMRRSLLAVLLCEPNATLHIAELAEQLWPGQVTTAQRSRIHIHVHRLRTALGDPARIVRRGTGYALVVQPGELDLDRFTGLVDNARCRRASGDRRAARDLLVQALAGWRGAAFADIELGPLLLPHATRLNELRLTVQEELTSLELAMGRHAGVVGQLRELVSRHPWRERLVAQLMLALYRCGRQVDALAEYRSFSRRLGDELGLRPRPQLRRLEHAILTNDPGLDQLDRPDDWNSEPMALSGS